MQSVSARSSRQYPAYGTLIVGGGPAGLGVLVAASKSGLLQELLDTSVCIVEKGATVGGGEMNNFAINSDTPGGVLLECFSDNNEASLSRLWQFPGIATLKARDSQHVPLKLIGDFLDHLGSCIRREVDAHPTSQLYLNSKVTRIDRDADGLYIVQLEGYSDRGELQVTTVMAENVILAPGGVQNTARDVQKNLFDTSTSIDDFPDKTILGSDGVLKGGDDFQRLVARISQGLSQRVVIVGSSHSAFASALFLLKQLGENAGAVNIEIVFRTQPKVFYASADAAQEDGYKNFDQNDICTTTDRVYRFGGLRMESRELLRQISGLDNQVLEDRVKLVEFTDEQSLRKLLSTADVIIPAIGYQPDYPPLFDPSGTAIAVGSANGMYVNQQCQILDDEGRAIDHLYGVGLASGYVPDNGGEPSFNGQTNSIWIYQNPAGKILVDAILDNRVKVSMCQ